MQTSQSRNRVGPGPSHSEQTAASCAYGLRPLPARAPAEAAIAAGPDCPGTRAAIRPLIHRCVSWATDVLRPTASLPARHANRIAEDRRKPPGQQWSAPEWQQLAHAVECKLRAVAAQRHRVSMPARRAPGASYLAPLHAAAEELHLRDGELWIDARKLLAGDHNHDAPGATDHRVWSSTGCTCLLVTSTTDILR